MSITQPTLAGRCEYTCITIPAIKGINSRIKGASLHKEPRTGNCINGLINKRIHRDVTVTQVREKMFAGKKCEDGSTKKLPALSKKDKAIAYKIKQVGKKRKFCVIRIKFPQVFVENKGLEETLSAGLHRNIGLLKRDDSNSPISNF